MPSNHRMHNMQNTTTYRHPMRSLPRVSASFAIAATLIVAPSCGKQSKAEQPATKVASTSKRSASVWQSRVDHDAWSKLGYRLDWEGFPFPLGRDSSQVTMFRPYTDMVLVQNKSSTIVLLEPATGAIRWSSVPADRLTKFVGLDQDPYNPGRVLVSSESEIFGLSAATGDLILRERLQKVVNTAPVLESGQAIFGTSTGEVHSHLVGGNVRAWAFDGHGSIEADPVRVGQYIGVVSNAGEVMFFSTGGAIVGHARIFGGLANDPVANESTLFIAGLDQSVWAFAPNGMQVWRYRGSAPIRSQPVVVGDTVYCDVPGKGMTAFDSSTGAIRWNDPKMHGTVVGTKRGMLIVWGGGTAMLIDPDRGDVLVRVDLPHVVKAVPDTFNDGNLYTVDDHNVVAKFTSRK